MGDSEWLETEDSKSDSESKRLGKHYGIYVSRIAIVISSLGPALLLVNINRRLNLFIPASNLFNPSGIPPIVLLTLTTSQFTLVQL